MGTTVLAPLLYCSLTAPLIIFYIVVIMRTEAANKRPGIDSPNQKVLGLRPVRPGPTLTHALGASCCVPHSCLSCLKYTENSAFSARKTIKLRTLSCSIVFVTEDERHVLARIKTRSRRPSSPEESIVNNIVKQLADKTQTRRPTRVTKLRTSPISK